MDRRYLLLLGMLLAALLLGGCAKGSAPSSAEGGNATSAATSTATAAAERGPASYQPLTPESDGEKKATASIGQAYATYLQMAEQSKGAVVYRDGDKVKPAFIGYQVRACSAKKANGKYDTASVLVLGGVVTGEPAWQKAGEMTPADVNPQYFVYEIPSIFEQPLPATTAREKDAMTKAKTWFDKNFADRKLERFDLAGYTFAYGQPTDEHWLLLQVRPDSAAVQSAAQ